MKHNKKILKSLLILLPFIVTSCNFLPVTKSSADTSKDDESVEKSALDDKSSIGLSSEDISSNTSSSTSAAHEHKWSDWEDAIPATCTEQGEQRRTCSGCNEVEVRTTAALGHYFVQDESKEDVAPTCLETGKNYEKCVRCGLEKVNTSAALGHAWVDASTYYGHDDSYVAPTSSTTGQKTQVCSRCEATQIVVLPMEVIDPATITTVPDNDMRNLQQYKFLYEKDITKFKTYATGADLSAPRGMLLRFEDVDTASKYYVQIAESEAGLNDAAIRECTSKVYTFHNAKLDTKYYYRAATSQAALSSASIKNITSTSIAPRVVYVPEVLNFRDIGGWDTSLVSGAKINQGLYYRCAQLDAASGSTKSCLDSAGKGLAAIKELGIKCDIDMRDKANQPSSGSGPSKANTSSWPITFVSAAVPSGSENVRWEGGTYQGTNIAQQYVKIFNAIANVDVEPIMLHCTYGADRTGIVTFFLESLIGMSEEDMTRDYVWTQFTQGRSIKLTESNAEFPKWISKTKACQGATFADKMENHLESFGISHATLEHIRELFVPGYVAQ